jgi:hypothetical protein
VGSTISLRHFAFVEANGNNEVGPCASQRKGERDLLVIKPFAAYGSSGYAGNEDIGSRERLPDLFLPVEACGQVFFIEPGFETLGAQPGFQFANLWPVLLGK